MGLLGAVMVYRFGDTCRDKASLAGIGAYLQPFLHFFFTEGFNSVKDKKAPLAPLVAPRLNSD